MKFLRRKQLHQRLRQDPYYRFKSLEEILWAAEFGVRIDVNRAAVDDLLRLPGISIHQAKAIISLTNNGVQFLSLEDFAAALGMAIARLQPLEPILNFSYYAPEVTPQKLRINQANPTELTQIPTIDLPLAQRIVNERQRGLYTNLAQMQQRLELSGQVISELLPWLSFS
ncbi:ComEA family DNA-binding protein [[Limnothrix rosea] IAM M-220]|uniref:ComEA family DNA-binding protein n=1 Tax=[Limnothrix rosea] IAM M-220 TaxID=454133 RepID=UPI00095E576A|nr:helix-hairpin-helix domain-containing protein [[Limnothrix rosea] IAM M-220]OKH18232.1 DNA uptake protein [[Limnothrix rosea] IAM M-220]